MKINEENIEAYLIDYSEGKLFGEEKNYVESFLKNNPEYADMFDGFENIRLEKETVRFEKKDSLKHTTEFDYPEFQYFDRLAVSVLEGVASESENKEFQTLISKNKKLKKDADVYSKTKIQPDFKIVYNKKKTLKHYALFFWQRVAAIAAVLIAAVLFSFLNSDETVLILGVYDYNYKVTPREILCEEKPIIAETKNLAKKKAAVKAVEKPPLMLPEIENEIKSVKNEALVGADFSSLKIENVLKDVLPQTDFSQFLAENAESQSKPKTNFIGFRLFRFAKKIDVEIFRSDDGSFIALDLITPNKKYTLKKL